MTEQPPVLGGRYALEEVIGRGGMAEVWRARDTRLGRDVAVKRLRVDLATDPTFQARFRREAQAAASLNHPNVVATYDTGEEADQLTGIAVPWIVMELVEGHTLRDLLRDGRRIRPERALEFAQGVLDALSYSHRAGIIHRDIKPANVMITPAGRVKVMDFGIARAVADTSATMTQTAAVIGTAQYLSPEQARGETVDKRSDIYSAGILLYELLTGRPPFTGDSPVSVAYQHVRELPTPPSHLDPSLSDSVDAVVLKALAKDPADRYDDAKDMRDDIARILSGQPVLAEPWSAPTEMIPTIGAPTAVTQAIGAPARAVSPASPLESSLSAVDPVLDDDEDEPRRSHKAGWIIGILLALLLTVGGWFLWTMFRPDPNASKVNVPDVITMAEPQATNALKNAGFRVEVVHEAGPADKTQGTVTDTDPDGNTLAERGSTVKISVNDGPDKTSIPKGLIGKSPADATKMLTAVGIKEANITVEKATEEQEAEHPEVKAGQVVASDPAEGADVVPDTQKVTLFTSQGRIKIPKEVVGKDEEGARDVLVAAGVDKDKIKIVQSTDAPDGTKVGTVFEADPAVGKYVLPDEFVTLTIAKEPEADPIPNVVGMTPQEAEKALAEAGYTMAEGTPTENPSMVGKVVSQDQPYGNTLKRGDKVTVHIGAASKPSTAPTPDNIPVLSVVGEKADKAQVLLKAAGFTNVVVEHVPTSDKKMDGKVIEQNPMDGTASAGQQITLKVAQAI